MRLFIAIDAEEINEYLKRLQKSFDGFGLRFSNSFHITLKFLGDIEDSDRIIKELSKIEFEKFNLMTSDIGVFPNKNNVRVLWIGIKQNDALTKLKKEIEDKLSFLEIKEKHNFNPHITLARVSYIKDKEKFKKYIDEIKKEEKSFDVDKFILYESTLTKKGPRYDVVKTFN